MNRESGRTRQCVTHDDDDNDSVEKITNLNNTNNKQDGSEHEFIDVDALPSLATYLSKSYDEDDDGNKLLQENFRFSESHIPVCENDYSGCENDPTLQKQTVSVKESPTLIDTTAGTISRSLSSRTDALHALNNAGAASPGLLTVLGDFYKELLTSKMVKNRADITPGNSWWQNGKKKLISPPFLSQKRPYVTRNDPSPYLHYQDHQAPSPLSKGTFKIPFLRPNRDFKEVHSLIQWHPVLGYIWARKAQPVPRPTRLCRI